MKNPTDIERLFQRIGLTDMRYHEFVSDEDPVRARESWSLVDSSVDAAGGERTPGHVPLARPAPPVRRSGAFYDRVAELRGARSSVSPESTRPAVEDSTSGAATEMTGERAARPAGSLRDVFSRVRREPSETSTSSSETGERTPLSEVFKRLS